GDPSDGLPGVRGIGEKSASELLRKYGSLDGILAAKDLTSGMRAKLSAGKDYIAAARRVVGAVFDCQVGDVDGTIRRAPSERVLVSEGAEWIHIVDLDGSRTGRPANLEAIRQIANRFTVKIQAGGGIRDFDTAEQFAEAGASRIVVGTAATTDPELIDRLVDRHADGLAVSVDARAGMVTTDGWTETTDVRAVDLMHRLAVAGVPMVIYTNVSVDGTLQGVDHESLTAIARAFGGDVIYSGGVGSLDDIRALARLRH